MVDKRKLHHSLVVLKRIKTWHLVLLFVALVSLSVYLLRQNNLEMVRLRDSLKQADESGVGVEQALSNLQRYVSTHMNTDLGMGVFLEQSYQRTYDAAVSQASNAMNLNSEAYNRVESGCKQAYLRDRAFKTYIACVENGLKALRPGSDPLASVKPPPQELFTYNFTSPVWSLDLAGLSLLASLVVLLLIIARLISYLLIRWFLKSKNS